MGWGYGMWGRGWMIFRQVVMISKLVYNLGYPVLSGGNVRLFLL